MFLADDDIVQGRISLRIDGGVADVDIVETAPHNYGHTGKYQGVGGEKYWRSIPIGAFLLYNEFVVQGNFPMYSFLHKLIVRQKTLCDILLEKLITCWT